MSNVGIIRGGIRRKEFLSPGCHIVPFVVCVGIGGN